LNSPDSRTDRDGRTPVHNAAFANDDVEIRRLARVGADLNAPDNRLLTPLHFAAKEYSLSAGKRLLELGAAVDLPDMFGNSPLHTAVFESRGRGDFIRLLLSHGADPLRSNRYGVTPYDLAHTIANYDVKQYFSEVEGPSA
jgi:ankyrin repeat protein